MTERDLILKCCSEIEQKLQWGPSERWVDQDFEKLAGLISERTKTKLSVSTLKRLWGKVAYDHLPSTSTLNALAIYNDYQSWREFWQLSNPETSTTGASSRVSQAVEHSHKTWWQKPQLRKTIFMIFLIVLGLLVYFLFS